MVPRGTSVAQPQGFAAGDPKTGWPCLKIAFSGPVHCRYSYRASGDYLGPKWGAPDPGPKGFEAAAECDFDGDGRTTVFTRTGQVLPSGAVVVLTEAFDSDRAP